MKRTEWVKNLDVTIAERNLLTHPFYQGWQARTLSRARLQLMQRRTKCTGRRGALGSKVAEMT